MLIIRGCDVRDEIERGLLSDIRCTYQAGRVDNMRTVMRLITIRRIEWQPQTYFSNIKRAVIQEIGYYSGYYHDI